MYDSTLHLQPEVCNIHCVFSLSLFFHKNFFLYVVKVTVQPYALTLSIRVYSPRNSEYLQNDETAAQPHNTPHKHPGSDEKKEKKTHSLFNSPKKSTSHIAVL